MADPQSPAPLATTLRMTEFEQIESVFAGWQGRIEQISSGSFDGTMQVVRGEGVRAVSAQGNQRLRVRGRDGAGLLAIYPICDRLARFRWNRTQLDRGQLFVVGVDDETDITSDRRFSGSVVFLNPEQLESTARLLRATDGSALPRISGACTPSAGLFAEFERRLALLFQMADTTPATIGTPEGRQLEQYCILALAAAILPTVEPMRPSAAGRAKLLSRAKELLRSHLDGDFGMLDLCQALDANDRTLRLVFLEQFGVGPMTYFRYLRLNAVREKLRTHPEIGIAAAAREFGFQHLGNFAAQYRRLFGSLPSAIRRR